MKQVALFLQVLHLAAVIACTNACTAQSTVFSYANPLDVSIADPSVLKIDTNYYLYGTTGEADGISVFTSTDLIHWSRQGHCYTKTPTTWGQSDFKSPEVIKVGSIFYLFYTARNPGINRRNICVATSSSPVGPFVDVKTPLLPTTSDFVDGHPFYDSTSNKYYLYYAREDSPREIQAIELATPPINTVGSATTLLAPSLSWEGSVLSAPCVYQHAGYYFLMYSANGASNPAIGTATSSSPLGPFTKPASNPIAKNSSTVTGAGHCTIAAPPIGNQIYIIYHTYLTPGVFDRQLAIDRLQFTTNPTGAATLSLVGSEPSSTLQPLPPGATPRSVGSTDEFNLSNLNRQKWNVFGEEPSQWALQNGTLIITTQNGDIRTNRTDARNIFLQYAPDGNFNLETAVSFPAAANFEQAFLILWQDQSNYVRVGTGFSGGAVFELGTETTGTYTGSTIPNTHGSIVRLKIERRGDQYSGYVGSSADSNWTKLGSTITMSTLQPQVGLGAIAPTSGAARQATFDYLRIITPTRVDDWQLY